MCCRESSCLGLVVSPSFSYLQALCLVSANCAEGYQRASGLFWILENALWRIRQTRLTLAFWRCYFPADHSGTELTSWTRQLTFRYLKFSEAQSICHWNSGQLLSACCANNFSGRWTKESAVGHQQGSPTFSQELGVRLLPNFNDEESP